MTLPLRILENYLKVTSKFIFRAIPKKHLKWSLLLVDLLSKDPHSFCKYTPKTLYAFSAQVYFRIFQKKIRIKPYLIGAYLNSLIFGIQLS